MERNPGRLPQTIAEWQDTPADEQGRILANAPDIIPGIRRVMQKWGRRRGLTRDEYEAAVSRAPQHDCPHCTGTGVVSHGHRYVGGIHPSSMTECLVRLYHDVQGILPYQSKIGIGLLATFELGTMIHRLYQRAIQLAYQAELEVPASDPSLLLEEGHIDAVGDFDGYRTVVEIKSISAKGWQDLRSPMKDHRLQAAAYALAVDAPFVLFLYINKEHLDMVKAYWRGFPDKDLDEWRHKTLQPLMQALADGNPPQVAVKKYECDACGYAHGCPRVYNEAIPEEL